MAYNAYRKYTEDPECYDRRTEKKKHKYDTIVREATIPGKYEESYILLHRAYYLYFLMTMCYIYHACSALSNLQAQSCVDPMLVSSSGLADVKATTGVSLKNLKIGGVRKEWTVEASLKQ